MLKAILKWLLTIVTGLVLMLSLFLFSMYKNGLRSLPHNTQPSSRVYSPIILDTAWVSIGESGSREMIPLTILTWIGIFLTDDPVSNIPKSMRVAGIAAKTLLKRESQIVKEYFSRMINEVSVAIWLSQRWTANQALSTFLTETYYGYCIYGFEKASLFYFGKTPEKLSDSAVILLVALTRSPNQYDPWLQRERAENLMKILIEQLKTKMGVETKATAIQAFDELLPRPNTDCK